MSEKIERLYRSGFVAVMGRPNVGKSTLINAILQQNIAAVSPKPQTTRQQQLGILTKEGAQIVFVDTPGIHKPFHKLGELMNIEASRALEDCDLILFIVDVSQTPPHEEDYMISKLIQQLSEPPDVIIALNKVDLIDDNELPERATAYQRLLPEAILLPISAARGEKLEALVDELINHLPQGPPFYPENQITDLYEREIAADLIRASALIHLKEEVPHAIAVRMDEYKERNEHGAYIAATLFVERESQKGIVIGEGGRMIKQIGSYARREIEAMSGRKVFLRLRVKVRKNWRNDDNALKLFGFGKAEER
jgi:GTP-binding protein Era